MKIAIDYRLAGYSMRGMAKYCKNICAELLKMPEFTKNDILFYIDKRTNMEFVPKNAKYRVLPTRNFAVGEQILLPFYLKKDKVNSLWSPHNTFPLFAPKSVNIYATWHDLVVMDKRMKTNSFLSELKRKYYAWIMGYGWHRLKGIATVSEYSKKIIESKYPIYDVIVTPNCISDFVANVTKLNSNNNYIQKDYYFTVSGEAWYKNLDTLFDYFRKNPDKNLKVAGLKSRSLFYKKCPSNIEILPFNISEDKLIQYYKECKAFIFISKYEGFGIPILEAMACGCKLIVSNVTSIPEVCGDNGIYINPDSLDELSYAIDQINYLQIDNNSYQKQLEKYISWKHSAFIIAKMILNK